MGCGSSRENTDKEFGSGPEIRGSGTLREGRFSHTQPPRFRRIFLFFSAAFFPFLPPPLVRTAYTDTTGCIKGERVSRCDVLCVRAEMMEGTPKRKS